MERTRETFSEQRRPTMKEVAEVVISGSTAVGSPAGGQEQAQAPAKAE